MKYLPKFIFTVFIALIVYLFLILAIDSYKEYKCKLVKLISKKNAITNATYAVYSLDSVADLTIATDKNQLKFQDLLDNHCDVRIINASQICLIKLDKYNLDDLEMTTAGEKIMYHTFWLPNAVKTHHLRVMKFNIMSYLATQDLKRTKLIVWSTEYLSIFKDLHNKFKKYVEDGSLDFRILDSHELCSIGIFKIRYDMCRFSSIGTGEGVISFSDLARYLVLYKYGGIYVDGDVIFLRDMKPFWNQNFVYRWSNTYSYNTAIMGLRRGHGINIEKIYQLAVFQSHNLENLINAFHPIKIEKYVKELNNGDIFSYKGLNVYHSALFDPAWLCNDIGQHLTIPNMACKFPDFYKLNITKEQFIENGGRFSPGAFTYHLHFGNCENCTISKNSYFYHVEKYFKSKLTKLN